MSNKDRLINDARITLHETWSNAVLEEEPLKQGNLKTEFRNLLQKEADNKLLEQDEIQLTAYKSTFDYNAEYSVERWYELEDVPSIVEVDGIPCDDLAEARRLMSGEEELEEPDYSTTARNLDFEFGNLLEKSIAVSVDWIELKTETTEEEN